MILSTFCYGVRPSSDVVSAAAAPAVGNARGVSISSSVAVIVACLSTFLHLASTLLSLLAIQQSPCLALPVSATAFDLPLQ